MLFFLAQRGNGRYHSESFLYITYKGSQAYSQVESSQMFSSLFGYLFILVRWLYMCSIVPLPPLMPYSYFESFVCHWVLDWIKLRILKQKWEKYVSFSLCLVLQVGSTPIPRVLTTGKLEVQDTCHWAQAQVKWRQVEKHHHHHQSRAVEHNHASKDARNKVTCQGLQNIHGLTLVI